MKDFAMEEEEYVYLAECWGCKGPGVECVLCIQEKPRRPGWLERVSQGRGAREVIRNRERGRAVQGLVRHF